MESSVFWDTMLCSLLQINSSFGGTCRLRLCLLPALYQFIARLNPSTPTKEVTYSSENSVDFQKTEFSKSFSVPISAGTLDTMIEVFVVFLLPSRHKERKCLDFATAYPLQI
jgi:hypothetical protein